MAIVITISKSKFMNEMHDGWLFSYNALLYMYDYYNDLSHLTDSGNIEFIPTEFRSAWDEFDDIYKLYDTYESVININVDEFMIGDDNAMKWDLDKEDEFIDAVLESLRKHTTAVALDGGRFLVLSKF